MAGESAQFGLRPRPPTPAIRPFDLMPRLQSMLDHANAALTQPFGGCRVGPNPSGLFTLAQTGVSLAPLLRAARAFLAMLTKEQRRAASFAIDDLAYLNGPLFADVSISHAASAFSAMIMSGLAVVGLVLRPPSRVLRSVSWISVLLLTVYLLNTLFLYLYGH